MLYKAKNPHGGDIYAGDITLDFSANINPLGTPPGVLEAIQAALPQVWRYPDPYCRELVAAIAGFENVPEDRILCGSGAAELIYAYCDAVKPRRALELAPTFSEYSLALERTGCQVERYFLDPEKDFAPDEGLLDFLSHEKPEALFLCSPNNPTGMLIPPGLLEKILRLCGEQGTRVFLDECFLDLAQGGVSMKPFLSEFPGLLILKAFTKSYGMAGVRLGYCLSADGALLARMSRCVQPWNVSVLAQAAGTAALKETEFLETTRALIFPERQWLKGELEALGFRVCPSQANFLLFSGPVGLDDALRSLGIAIRSCANYRGLGPGWYRTAVRLHDENEMLIDSIRRVFEEAQSWQKTL